MTNLRMKLISAIVSFCVVFSLLIIGVMATPTASVSMGGSLTFTASGVYAKVERKIENAVGVSSSDVETLNFSASDTTSEKSWAKDLSFDSNGTSIIMTITVTNLATDRPLYVKLVDNVGSVTNLTKTIKNGTSTYKNTEIEVEENNGTTTFTITFSVNPNISLTDATYNFTINLYNEATDKFEDGLDASKYKKLTFTDYDEENKTVSVMAKSTTETIGDVIIPSKVKYNNVVYTVTSIPTSSSSSDGAFYDCTEMTSITLPNTLTSIGDDAFYGCSGLTAIEIPNSVTSIGYDAFNGCSSLTYNTYDNAKYLGNKDNKYFALIQCTAWTITSCEINENCKIIADSAFCSGTVISCQITSITIPNNVIRIGNDAFALCKKLKSAEIESSIIGDYAFEQCTSLTTVTIGSSIIGDYAFEKCTSLNYVTIESNVSSIGFNAFYNCSKIRIVEFEETTGWWVSTDATATSGDNISYSDLSDTSTAATYLTSTYLEYYWKRS